MAHKEMHDRKPAYFFDLHDETSVRLIAEHQLESIRKQRRSG